MHDFDFYKLSLHKIRWIGGFGEIAWLKNKNWKPLSPRWLSTEMQMIEHMNEDHQNVIYSTLKAQHGKADKKSKNDCTMHRWLLHRIKGRSIFY
jgi:hypothetical protein